MVQLQDAQRGAEVTSEATERELELEAQLVEARSIIQEQVLKFPLLHRRSAFQVICFSEACHTADRHHCRICQ